MNKIYRTVWSRSRCQLVVASEIACHRGSGNGEGGGTLDLRKSGGGSGASAAYGRAGMALRPIAAALSLGLIFGAGPAVAEVALDTGAVASDVGAVAIGQRAKASGNSSLALGVDSAASDTGATSIGLRAKASGNSAIAFGSDSAAAGVGAIGIGVKANAAFDTAIALGSDAGASAISSIAIGTRSVASNASTIAIGPRSQASGNGATALGADSAASADNAIALGARSKASFSGATAVGTDATSLDVNAVALGARSKASGNGAIAFGAEGNSAGIGAIAIGIRASSSGNSAIAFGSDSVAKGIGALSMGLRANSSVDNAMALGTQSTASGDGAIALGSNSRATGTWGVAIGTSATSNGFRSSAIGAFSSADGDYAQALGQFSNASGAVATAVGRNTQATGSGSVALGSSDNTLLGGSGGAANASGANAIAIGASSRGQADNATAIGSGAVAGAGNAFAGGVGSSAKGVSSVALGDGALAQTEQSVAIGKSATAKGGKAVSIGAGNVADGDGAVAIGDPNIVSGAGAVGMGKDNTVNGDGAVAIGNTNNAQGQGSIALGIRSSTTGAGSVALGDSAAAQDLNSIAIGSTAKSNNASAVAIGGSATADGFFSVALGAGAKSTNALTTAVGNGAAATNDAATALGVNSTASGIQALALGSTSTATAQEAIAIGNVSKAVSDYSMAIGSNASASASQAIALGRSSSATLANSVAIGSSSQTDSAATSVTGVTLNGTSYSFAGTAPTGVVSIGSSGSERQLKNLAAGDLSATSTDAVNGSQLFATNQALSIAGGKIDTLGTSTAGTLGGNAAYDATTGKVTVSNVGGTGKNTVNDAIAAVQQTANTGWNVQANGDTATQVKPGDKVQFKDGQNIKVTRTGTDITVATADDLNATSITTGNSKLDTNGLTIANGPSVLASGINAGLKTITNVASGTVTASSTDAVNGSQLFATGNSMRGVLGGNATYANGSLTMSNIGNTGQSTIHGAINNVNNTANNAATQATGANATANAALSTANTAIATANLGWNIQTNGDTPSNVAPGTTVELINGQNIKVTRSGTGVTIATADDIAATSVTTGNAKLDTTGLTITNGPSVLASGIDAGGKKISNVAKGDLSAASKDAVNGNQLFATNTNVTNLQGDVTNLTNNVKNGTTGVVQRTTTADTTVLTAAGATSAAPGNAQKLTNLAAGTVASGSTDAVNGGQLFASNSSIAGNLGGGATVNPNGTISAPTYTIQGNNYSNVGSAFDGVNGSLTTLNTQITNINGGGGIKYFHANSSLADSDAGGANSIAVGPVAVATGASSIATGNKAAASGASSTAVGDSAKASADNAMAIGAASTASGVGSISMGRQSVTNEVNSIAIGTQAQALWAGAVSIGGNADAMATRATAVGSQAKAFAVNSTAIGGLSRAIGERSTAIGWQAGAGGISATAMGDTARAKGDNSVAIGTSASAETAEAVSIGNNAVAKGGKSVSIGSGNTANGDGAVAIGDPNTAGTASVAMGRDNSANGNSGFSGAVALGDKNTASGLGAVALGSNNSAIGVGSVAIGADSTAGNSSVAIGSRANAGSVLSIAVGQGASASLNNSVAIGADSTTANAATRENGVTLNGNNFSFAGNTPAGVVSVGAAGAERQIKNVAAGALSATSTDGVNGSQLFATNQALTSASTKVDTLGTSTVSSIGGNASYDSTTGTLTAGTNIGGTGQTTIAGAIGSANTTANTALDTANKGWNVQANGDTATQVKPGDTVQFKDGQNIKVTRTGTDITVATADDLKATSITTGNAKLDTNGLAITNGPSVLASGIDAGDKKISNVANGDLSAASKDAVNGNQLFATNQAITGLGGRSDQLGTSTAGTLGGNAAYDPATGKVTVSNVGGTGKDTVNDAIASVQQTANAGWNVQANGDTATQVKPGDTVQFKDGQNIKVTRTGTDITVATSDDLKATSITTGNAKLDTTGLTITNGPSVLASGIDAGDKKISNVANGDLSAASKDAVNGNQLFATNQAITGLGGRSDQLGTSTAGTLGGNAAYDPATGKVTVSNVGGTGKDTVNDAIAAVQQTANTGWNVQANGDTATQVKPGDTVQFKDGQNIKVTRNGSDITVATADDLKTTSITTGNAKLDTNGLAIANGPSVLASGIDAGDKKITNVANGDLSAASKDAVNGNQLFTTNQTVNDVASNTSQYLGGGADVKNGKAPSYSIGGSTYNNVGDVFSAIDGGSSGVVQRTSTLDETVLTAKGGTAANPGNAQRLTNLAAGAVSSSSTDAVNGSQLFAVDQKAGAGWNISAQGSNSTNVAPGATVDLKNSDGNIVVRKTASGNDVTFDLSKVLTLDSLTMGNTFIDTAGVKVGSDVVLGSTGLVIANGPSVTRAGVDAGGMRIVNVAAGSAATDAVNVSQLQAAVSSGRTRYYGANDGGTQGGNSNGDGATGSQAMAAGVGATASGAGASAVGAAASASGAGAVALGRNASARADGSVAVGDGASDGGRGAERYTGTYSGVQNDTAGTVSIGNASAGQIRTLSNVADAREATDAVNLRQLDGAVRQANVYTDSRVQQVSQQTVQNTTNVQNLRDGKDGLFQVNNTDGKAKPSATGSNAAAGGSGAVASGDRSLALGTDAQATANNAVALGSGAVADRANSVSVGAAGRERQVTNVAAGSADTDAVNVSQLRSSQQGMLRYDTNPDGTSNYSRITMGNGQGPATISNVAPGVAGTDAVNVDQLNQGLAEQRAYTDRAVNTVRREANAGIAAAIATANLPQAYAPGRGMTSVAIGTYGGQSALAVGASVLSDSGRWIFKFSGSATTRGSVGVGGGVGFAW